MNAALFLIIGCAVLIVGYIFYGGWLAKKWGVDNSRVTVRLPLTPWKTARTTALPRLLC